MATHGHEPLIRLLAFELTQQFKTRVETIARALMRWGAQRHCCTPHDSSRYRTLKRLNISVSVGIVFGFMKFIINLTRVIPIGAIAITV